jgi:hypothetical protein
VVKSSAGTTGTAHYANAANGGVAQSSSAAGYKPLPVNDLNISARYWLVGALNTLVQALPSGATVGVGNDYVKIAGVGGDFGRGARAGRLHAARRGAGGAGHLPPPRPDGAARRAQVRLDAGSQFKQLAVQHLEADGLGDEVVHAGLQASLLVAPKASPVIARIGVCRARPAADPPGRLEAVHPGHAQVHQDQGVGAGRAICTASAPQAAMSTASPVGAKILRQLAVVAVVLDQQDALPGERLPQPRSASSRRCRRRGRRAGPSSQAEPEGAAHPGVLSAPSRRPSARPGAG